MGRQKEVQISQAQY